MMKSWVIRLHQGSNYPTGIFLDGIWGVWSHWDDYFVIEVCFIVQNTQKYVKIDHDVKEKYYTHLHSCDNIVNHTCSLGFKLPNRDLFRCYLGWLIILRWLFRHRSVFYWSKYTKLCQNRSWYQNKTRYYNYTTLSRRIEWLTYYVSIVFLTTVLITQPDCFRCLWLDRMIIQLCGFRTVPFFWSSDQ